MKLHPPFAAPLAGASLLVAGLARAIAQDIQERTIKLRPPEQRRPPGELRRQALRRTAGGQERRQDEGAGVPGLAAGQRDAAAVGAAGRRAGDVGAGDHLAGRHRQGIRPGRLPVRRRATSRRPTRCSTARSARRCIAKLPEKGLVALGYWDLGFRNVTNSKRPITKPEDLEGLKIRVIPNPVFLETFKAFKANPVPMPFAELYGALEAKAVDGQENPFAVILSNKFYEVQKYVSATNHVYAANIVLVSKRSGTSCRRPSRR